MKMTTNLNMVKHQILNGIIQQVEADPTTKLVPGWIIYNTTESKFKYYDGSKWVAVGTGGGGGGGSDVSIATIITDTSTNNDAAGAKAVYDFVTTQLSDIRAVTNGYVLRVDPANNTVVGIAIDTAVTENSDNLITSDAVYDFINAKLATIDAMKFMGTVDNNCTITSSDTTLNGNKLTSLSVYEKGWVFKASNNIEGTKLSLTTDIEAGDMIIVLDDAINYNASNISIIQNNIDGAVVGPDSSTDNSLAVFDGNTGKLIKSSTLTNAQLLDLFNKTFGLDSTDTDITIESTNVDDNTIVKPGQTIKATLNTTGVTANTYGDNVGVIDGNVDDGDSFVVPQFTVDAKGRITNASQKTINLKLETMAKRYDAENPDLTANSDGDCVWVIEVAHTMFPVVTLYEVATKEVVISDIKDDVVNDEIVITFCGTGNIAAGTYHATIIT